MRVSNFMTFFTTISLLVIVVLTTSVIKIRDEHETKLMYAMESKVEYYAKRCYIEEKCFGEVTLSMLYDNGYLEEIIHPVSKEVIDYDTKINYDGESVTINWQY